MTTLSDVGRQIRLDPLLDDVGHPHPDWDTLALLPTRAVHVLEHLPGGMMLITSNERVDKLDRRGEQTESQEKDGGEIWITMLSWGVIFVTKTFRVAPTIRPSLLYAMSSVGYS